MDKKVRIGRGARKKCQNYWYTKEVIKEAMAHWKEMGFMTLRKDFKKMVQEL